MIKFLSRKLLDMWGSTGIAPGWYCQTFEKFGFYLASPHLLPAFLPNNCWIYCNLQDHVQRQIYFLGVYEPIETHLFTSFLKPGMTVIDAGANVGQYTLIASTIVGASGAVHSFEPVPETFAHLQRNVLDNKLLNVHLNQAALWNESIRINLGLSEKMSRNAGSYSIGVINPTTAVESVSICLDEYVASKLVKRVDLMKMDIEGAEFCAFLGMQNILERDHPALLVEINRSALQSTGYTPEDLWLLLTSEFGYNGYLIEINSCKKISEVSKIDQSNIIFIHPSKTPSFISKGYNFKNIFHWARSGKK